MRTGSWPASCPTGTSSPSRAAANSPVINALTDSEHPCQVLADCMTVRSVTGRLAGATVAYIGDGNNVCTSWIYAAALLGVHLRVICPPRLRAARRRSSSGRPRLRGAGHRYSRSRHEAAPALRDADIIYTDVWTSMGQETEQQRRREDFAFLQVNDALVALAPAECPGDALPPRASR